MPTTSAIYNIFGAVWDFELSVSLIPRLSFDKKDVNYLCVGVGDERRFRNVLHLVSAAYGCQSSS